MAARWCTASGSAREEVYSNSTGSRSYHDDVFAANSCTRTTSDVAMPDDYRNVYANPSEVTERASTSKFVEEQSTILGLKLSAKSIFAGSQRLSRLNSVASSVSPLEYTETCWLDDPAAW